MSKYKKNPRNAASAKTALPGVFSVSENKKVQFSSGAMTYKMEGGTSISSSQFSADTDYFCLRDEKYMKWETKSGVWRVLSAEEWEYLVKERPNAFNLLGVAGVADKYYGVVLLPDNFQLPAGVTFTPGLGPTWVVNKYTFQEWQQLADAGAVFLPEGRYLMSGSRERVGCIYWTSSGDKVMDQYGKISMRTPYTYIFNCIDKEAKISNDPEDAVRLELETQTVSLAMYRYVKDC